MLLRERVDGSLEEGGCAFVELEPAVVIEASIREPRKGLRRSYAERSESEMEEQRKEHDSVPDQNRNDLGGRRQDSPTRLLGAPHTRRRPLYATRVYANVGHPGLRAGVGIREATTPRNLLHLLSASSWAVVQPSSGSTTNPTRNTIMNSSSASATVGGQSGIQEVEVDPIWMSSRTARQIYALGEVEKVGVSASLVQRHSTTYNRILASYCPSLPLQCLC